MKTDLELRSDILSELQWDPSIRDEDIAIAVKDGVVTLAGTVDSYAQRHAAERAIERVKGARAIANDLTVALANGVVRSDADIAHAAVNALHWNVQVPEERIRVKVSDGWLTLEGEVDRRYERQAAEDAVRYLLGLKGITNLITLHPGVRLSDITQRIRSSLKRHEEVDVGWITAETSGARMTLHPSHGWGTASAYGGAPFTRDPSCDTAASAS